MIDRAEDLTIVPRRMRLMFRLFGIEHYVKVKQISDPSAGAKVAAGNSRGDEGRRPAAAPRIPSFQEQTFFYEIR